MKKVLLAVILSIVSAQVYSQCPGCVINTACTASPAFPTLCPSILPDGVVGQPYDQDLTFYMPSQFQYSGIDVTLNQINVTNITGQPTGLNFTCSAPNCTYFPSQNPPATERGCVKICGVPIIPGNYTIIVSVVAQASTPVGNQTLPTQFEIPIRINPPAGGNAGFTFNPPSGCDSVCVTYQGLISDPDQPETYNWNFGNGQTSTDQNPPVQCYTQPGDYIVTLNTKILKYVLDAVTVTVNGGFCGDIEEPNLPIVGCTSAPDPYFVYSNGTATFSTESQAGDDNATMSWTGLNHALESNSFALTFYDYDPTSADDNLGVSIANVSNTGTFNFVNGNYFGSYTIITTIDQEFNHSDTITVFAPPPAPIVSIASGVDSVCIGDSILLVASAANMYQWYTDSTAIIGANNDSIWVSSTGNYWVKITDGNGCNSSNSDTAVVISVIPYPPVPGLYYTNGGATINTSLQNNSPYYTLQWYYSQVPNAGGLPIPNQTTNSLTPTLTGYYYIVSTNLLGCSSYSDTVLFQKVGISENLLGIEDVNLYPNPTKGQFTLEAGLLGNENTAIIVRNVIGQTVYNENIGKQTGKLVRVFDMPLSKGIYIVEISRPAGSIVRKLIVE